MLQLFNMANRRSEGSSSLPLARVKTIMKSSPEVSNIGQDALVLIARSAELFIQDLAVRTHEQAADKNEITYKDLAEIVNENESLQFLQDIIPRKLKARDFFAMMGKPFPGATAEREDADAEKIE